MPAANVADADARPPPDRPYASWMRSRWQAVTRGVALAGALVVALLGFGSCTSDKPAAPAQISVSDAYTAIVRWEVGRTEPPTSAAVPLPTIFVTAENGNTIDARVQATVAKSTVTEAKVRFADVRDDAVDVKVDGSPVKDGGVLLIVDDIVKGQSRLTLGVTEYRELDDKPKWDLTLVADSTGVSVTSASPQPSD